MKINLGSNNKRIEGFINVDALRLPNVDWHCDITKTPWLLEGKEDGRLAHQCGIL